MTRRKKEKDWRHSMPKALGRSNRGSERQPEGIRKGSELRVVDRKENVKGGEDTQGDNTNPYWRQSIIRHRSNPGNTRDKKVHQQALKYMIMDDELYRRTVDGVLLKCLGRCMKVCVGHIRRRQK
jgi:hypothetical protein